jgi:hypothetical protein
VYTHTKVAHLPVQIAQDRPKKSMFGLTLAVIPQFQRPDQFESLNMVAIDRELPFGQNKLALTAGLCGKTPTPIGGRMVEATSSRRVYALTCLGPAMPLVLSLLRIN